MSIRQLARTLDISDTNIRNYITRDSKPSSDVMERLVRSFPNLNTVWLITGEGEPFKDNSAPAQISGKKNTVNVSGTNIGTANQTNNYTISECEKERDGYKAQLELAKKEIESLHSQLEWTKILIESKNDIIGILKAPHHGSPRPEDTP